MYGSQWTLGPALGLTFLFVLAVAVTPVAATLEFEANGKNYSTSTVQLWYEGHWKQVRRKRLEKARAENFLEPTPEPRQKGAGGQSSVGKPPLFFFARALALAPALLPTHTLTPSFHSPLAQIGHALRENRV